MRNLSPSTHELIILYIGDCAVNGDYEDLPDELNQSKDNPDLAEEGEDDDQQVKMIGLALNRTKLFLDNCEISKISGRRWDGEWNKAAQWENH